MKIDRRRFAVSAASATLAQLLLSACSDHSSSGDGGEGGVGGSGTGRGGYGPLIKKEGALTRNWVKCGATRPHPEKAASSR